MHKLDVYMCLLVLLVLVVVHRGTTIVARMVALPTAGQLGALAEALEGVGVLGVC